MPITITFAEVRARALAGDELALLYGAAVAWAGLWGVAGGDDMTIEQVHAKFAALTELIPQPKRS